MEGELKRFFAGIDKNNALVFATFGLDEIVLVGLLKKHGISKNQRIVVFHEIMKHRNPGFLSVHYHNSKIIAVELSRNKAVKTICPIFHSKIWLEVSELPFKCIKLAVSSINLTQYHLSAASKTLESFAWWKNLSLRLSTDYLFSKKNIFLKKGKFRLVLTPKSFFLNMTIEKPVFESHSAPIYKIVEKNLDATGEVVVGCAAPFVSLSPIRRLASSNNKLKIWWDERSDGTKLHAKIIETNKHLFLGSPNLTKQAFGLIGGQPINHETIVFVKKKKNFRLSNILRGFPSLSIKELEDDDPIEDFEARDITDSNWLEQKEQAEQGPNSVKLVINEATGKVEMHIKGDLSNIKQISIHAFAVEKHDDEAILTSKPTKRIQFNKENRQEMLAKAVLAPATPLVKGLNGKKIVWIRELDLGEFWRVLEKNISYQIVTGSSGNGNNNGKKDDSSNKRCFADVRVLRATAYEKKISPRMQSWYNWLHRYNASFNEGMPDWCIDLANKIRNA